MTAPTPRRRTIVNELGHTIAMAVTCDQRGVTVDASGPTSMVEHTWTPLEAAVLRDLLPAAPSGETAPRLCVLCDDDEEDREPLCARHLVEFRWHGHQDTAFATVCGGYYCSCGLPLPCPERRVWTPPRPCPILDATPDEVEIEAWQNYDGPNAEYRLSMGPYAGPPHARIQVRHRCGWSISFAMGVLQWSRVEGEVRGHFGAVPVARTNAAGTPTHLQRFITQYGDARAGIAVCDAAGDTGQAEQYRAKASALLDLIRIEIDRLATPSGEQPTTEPAGEVDSA